MINLTKPATATLATLANMHRYYGAGVLAYSPITGEEYPANPAEYSANPADYYGHYDPHFVLKDSEGEPMILVRRALIDVTT